MKTQKEMDIEDDLKVSIYTMEEWKAQKADYPYKHVFFKSMQTIRYCKIELYPSCIQGTMHVPRWNEEKQREENIIDFGFYMKDQMICFVGDKTYLEENVFKIKKLLEKVERVTPQTFLIAFMEGLIEEDVIHLQEIEKQLERLEEILMDHTPPAFYEQVLYYRKQLSLLHSYYEQLMNIGDIMQLNLLKKQNETELMEWQLFGNRAERLHDTVELLKDYVVQIRELYQSRIDIRQNKIMSALTVVTTIFFPLTLIAGWYGMNFAYMPEINWRYGYVAVVIVSLLIVAAEIFFFKKRKML